MKPIVTLVFVLVLNFTKAQTPIELSKFAGDISATEMKSLLSWHGYVYSREAIVKINDENMGAAYYSKQQIPYDDTIIIYKGAGKKFYDVQYLTYVDHVYMNKLKDFMKDPNAKYLEGKGTALSSTTVYERLGFIYSFTVEKSKDHDGLFIYITSVSNTNNYR